MDFRFARLLCKIDRALGSKESQPKDYMIDFSKKAGEKDWDEIDKKNKIFALKYLGASMRKNK